MSAYAPDWLMARAIAHRGLHDQARGVAENSLPAAEAAIRGGFAIECDVQLSRDGEAMVFHDDALDRLTGRGGLLAEHDAAALAAMALGAGEATIPTLSALLARIGGRTPLVCEIKSGFRGDARLAKRAQEAAARYAGPLAFKSFDPDIVAMLREAAPRAPDGTPRPLGIVAMARYERSDWPGLTDAQRRDFAAFAHVGRTRPDFLSFCVDDLPHPAPNLLRALAGAPTMAWTVRGAEQRRAAAAHGAQIVFEGAGRP